MQNYAERICEVKTMDDLISRRKAISTVEDAYSFSDGDIEAYHDAMVASLTELIAEQPKTGRWILVKGSNGKDYHKCSCCLHTQEITGVKNYCSVCGADMMGVEHETD